MNAAESIIAGWTADPDISARSVLVTIFGDTVIPVTNSLWLSELFTLTDVFGFSRRLVRTSMFRLASEGWLTNERVGRQSRYHLTPLAVEESEQAGDRIYRTADIEWSGSWTLAFLDRASLDDERRRKLRRHLLWQGFIALDQGLLASPNATVERVKDLCRVVEPDLRLPLATAEFADLEQLVSDRFFDAALDVDSIEKDYRGFLQRYRGFLDDRLEALVAGDSLQAFAVRTMLIHDLRRIRLRSFDVPPQLLPAPWIGDEAVAVTANAYRQLSPVAAPGLGRALDLAYPTTMAGRFDP